MYIDIINILYYCNNINKNKLMIEINNFLKVISDKNRLMILTFLAKDKKCVCEIWKYLDLPQNLVSHHLKVLKNFKLISSQKEGSKVIYWINQEKITQYLKLLDNLLKTGGKNEK